MARVRFSALVRQPTTGSWGLGGKDGLGRLVDEPDVGHPTQGNNIVAVGEPPQMPHITFAVAKDGASWSPIQGRDGHVRLINQNMSLGFGPHLGALDEDIVHNPQVYQFWGLGSRGKFYNSGELPRGNACGQLPCVCRETLAVSDSAATPNDNRALPKRRARVRLLFGVATATQREGVSEVEVRQRRVATPRADPSTPVIESSPLPRGNTHHLHGPEKRRMARREAPKPTLVYITQFLK